MGRSSSKQGSKGGMEIDKLQNNSREEPHLSGAYIRSLVKQLTSSRPKDPLNPKDPDGGDSGGGGFPSQNIDKLGQQQPQHPPQQIKKQVRRRLHTSRPYQERLLNMAEARREIVTALKFHRASMKQANEQQQQRPQSLQSPPPQPFLQLEESIKSRSNPSRIYPSTTPNCSSYLENFSYSSSLSYNTSPFSWPASPIACPPVAESFNIPLPNQTLGLNLNFHDFNDFDANLCNSHNNNKSSSFCSSSSPSPSSSSPVLSVATEDSLPLAAVSHEGPSAVADMAGGGLHPAMDDKEMAEIRSIGEQHEVEWNDTMNLVTSAWWFKFLKTMEIDPEVRAEDNGLHPFDEIMEFPSWLNANEACLQEHFNDLGSDYLQDPGLPCMNIGEIEGMDGEWLA